MTIRDRALKPNMITFKVQALLVLTFKTLTYS